MRFPASLTTVTKFSKILALILFVTLPFFWFYLGLLVGIKQGTAKENYSPTTDTKTIGLYSTEQLRAKYTYGVYEYAEVWRANMNVPIKNSTDYAGVVRKPTGSSEWQEYIKIVSSPDQSKNNPYKIWVGDSLYLLLVDQNGGGSGEGIAKLAKVTQENNTYEQIKCFYYVPERHESLDVENIMSLEDSDSPNCYNYTLDFK